VCIPQKFEVLNMDRRFFNRAGGGLFVGLAGLLAARPASAEPTAKQHRVALQVSSDDPAVMTLVLNNATNVAAYYRERNQDVQIEIVAFGPGYLMLRDISPVKERISTIRQQLPFVILSACQNSRRSVATKENKKLEEIAQLPGTTDVPAGVVRLSELQEDGWSYVRT
jgi:intracellular sulfur oxidation DsrE/DsrF family protein